MATGLKKKDSVKKSPAKVLSDKVLYLYAVSMHTPPKIVGLSGIDGVTPVEAIHCAEFVCWISKVDRAEFADELANNMENLDWLAQKTTQHQQIVSAIAESTDVMPARFGTVFLSESSLTRDIEERKALLRSDFRRIEGTEEWGIKVFKLPPKQAARTPIRSGKEYLQAKSAILRMRADHERDEEISQFVSALEKLAVASADGGRIAGGRRDLQFQTSILVRRTHRKKLEDVLRQFSTAWEDSRQIECTGPWPPYSFVSRVSSL